MDVDLIFKRGMVYTLAAAAIVGVYFAVVAGVAETGPHPGAELGNPFGLVLAMVVTALLFDPCANGSRSGLTSSSIAPVTTTARR